MTNIYTIPPETSFLDALATGLWQHADHDPARLAAMRVFLPTRRACRLLQDPFFDVTGGKATLLPRMQPIGDIDEDELLFADAAIETEIPPALAPLRRRLLLAQLIQKRDPAMQADQAVHLAEALARFLDEAQIRHCDFAKLPGLVQQRELAVHWQDTVKFLSILTEAWPLVLAAEGCIDPADRRNRVLAAQAAAWRSQPPAFPIIAAGSTGSMPSTADFLAAIAELPTGMVVLPGLDQGMDEATWQAVDEFHPQHGMKELLAVMETERKAVQPWSVASSEPPRAFLLREAMRPAAVSEEWRHLNSEKLPPACVTNLSRATFAHTQEEAQGIALMLREALEQPAQKVALVTPDRNLGERVAALLARWNIQANDSAGASLAEQPVGGFLAALLNAAAPHAGAVAWLSVLKHPLAACGLAIAECRSRARHLELTYWRTEKPEASAWLDELKRMLRPMTSVWNVERPLGTWIEDHLRIAEQYTASNSASGADRLWQGEDGEAAVTWLNDLQSAAENFAPIDGATYANLFEELLRQTKFRASRNLHPRLSILGPLEARLLRPDLVILGGMNEGVWPPEIAVDPWLSRPMKKDFGMAPAEYRIGLSAHDFVQLASAPKVILTRSLRSGGSPTVPSRFLLQLETVLRAAGLSTKDKDALQPQQPWQEWARMLDEPAADDIKPCTAPEPRPPVELRPKSLSVTEIGTWQRNPYAIYAKHVLGLKKLDELESEIDASDRGNLIHAALEKFIDTYKDRLPSDAETQLLKIGRELFTAYDEHPEVKAFWWPRFERIAAWFVMMEQERRDNGIRPLKAEAKGLLDVGGFTLRGRADRIDRMADGSVAITDYKTGGVPSKAEVESGIEPQLPLLGLIAERGGFKDIKAAKTGELNYWKLGGGQNEDSNKTTEFTAKLDALIAEAEEGLKQLIATFNDASTPYQAVPKPGRAPRYDDYAHLARLAEWGRTNED